MKHAPVADALERLILISMADAADSDGCNSFRSIRSHALIATGVDKSTIVRRQRAMERRGLIRRDTSPPPARYLRISPDRRPVRWEVCIPYSWWSDAQREQIQREREDKGLSPITLDSRPDLPDAPGRTPRADKGKPNPNRRRKSTREVPEEQERGVSETPRDSGERGVYKTPRGVSTRHLAGCLQDTQPSCVDLPVEPSSSSERLEPERDGGCVQEEEGRLAARDRQDGPEAYAVVDAAAARWVGHRAPTAAERRRLAQRVAAALAEGAQRHHVVHALTRDLAAGQVRTTAVQVVMGRTAIPGWADPPVHVSEPRPAPHPTWCGTCERTTRMQQLDDGRVGRCRTCHPHYATGAA